MIFVSQSMCWLLFLIALVCASNPIKTSFEVTSTRLETTIHLTVENTADYDIQILKRGTPLAGIRSDCLTITRNGQTIPYDGFHYRLIEEPLDHEYQDILAGESLTFSHDVSRAYSGVSLAGEYKITTKSSIKYWKKSQLSTRKERPEPMIQPLSSSFAVLNVMVDGVQRPRVSVKATPQNFTFEENQQKRSTTSRPTLANTPYFVGSFTQAEQDIVTDSHRAAHLFLWAADQQLNSYLFSPVAGPSSGVNSQFVTYFGSAAGKGYTSVKNNFATLVSVYVTEYQAYAKGSSSPYDCGDGSTIAYTTASTSGGGLFLCPLFFHPNLIFVNRYHTLIHEMCHLWLGQTDWDGMYGLLEAKSRAINNPALAKTTPDNYAYFAVMCFPFEWAMDAVVTLPDGHIYAFLGTLYIKYTDAAATIVETDYPKPTRLLYSIPNNLQNVMTIDTVLVFYSTLFTPTIRTFVFSRTNYYLFPTGFGPGWGANVPLVNTFTGTTGTNFANGIDSALQIGNKIYVTKGNQCMRYSDTYQNYFTPDPGYPKFLSDCFAGYPETKIDTMAIIQNKIKLVYGNKFYRYSSVGVMDSGYPKDLTGLWGKVPYYE